jgi:hypothetical protein
MSSNCAFASRNDEARASWWPSLPLAYRRNSEHPDDAEAAVCGSGVGPGTRADQKFVCGSTRIVVVRES